MKQKLHVLLILLLVTAFSFSQTQTVTINWGFNSVPFPEDDNGVENQDTSITIEEGDTVVWDWLDAGFHNVKSTSGPEAFGTAGGNNDTFQGPDFDYQFTFTLQGTYTFECVPHAPIMYGTIVVVPEGTLSTNNFEEQVFKVYPNPGTSVLNVSIPSLSGDNQIEIFDVLGKRIYFQNLTDFNTIINISKWQSGMYIVNVSNGNSIQTKRFVKQ